MNQLRIVAGAFCILVGMVWLFGGVATSETPLAISGAALLIAGMVLAYWANEG